MTMKLLATAILAATPLFLLAAAPPTANSKESLPASAPALGQWNVDPGHSTVLFRTMHLGVSWNYGRFNEFEGQVQYDPAKPTEASVELSVTAASVDTNSADRDAHLRNTDFFSAKEFPKIAFKSTKVTAGKDGTLDVTGDLSFHGVTKSITIEIEPTGSGTNPKFGTRAGFHTTFAIDASDYEVSFMQGKDLVGPMVELTVSLETVEG